MLHNVKQLRMTPRKAFYKKLKEVKVDFQIYFTCSFQNFPVNPYYEPLVWFIIMLYYLAACINGSSETAQGNF